MILRRSSNSTISGLSEKNIVCCSDVISQKSSRESFRSSDSANTALPVVTPVNNISEKTTLRSCVLFITKLLGFCI